jgi:hypothetical protein
MPVTVSSKRPPQEETGSANGLGERRYKVEFEVDQTDAGPLADGIGIVLAAQLLVGDGRVPETGEHYDYFTEDLDSFCQNLTWERTNAKELATRWKIIAEFGPVTGDPSILNVPPLSRPVIYDIDWIEEQVPLEQARIVEGLPHIGRAAGSLGPVCNSCGIEFTEAALKTIYYPILIAQKNYATLDEIVALNLAYQGTTNSDTFFDASARKAKYLMTASGGQQQQMGQTFYPGTTRVWFKQPTWDRQILNNGWGHFKKTGTGAYMSDDLTHAKWFKNKVHDDPDADETADPKADASEPMNLALDGTLAISTIPAIYLTFRDLNEVSYAGIGIGIGG